MATEKSNVMLIRDYFFNGAPAAVIAKEIKALTPTDREQLGSGIRSGSLTY